MPSIPADTLMESDRLSVTLFSCVHSQVEPPGRPLPMLCLKLPGLAYVVCTPYVNSVSWNSVSSIAQYFDAGGSDSRRLHA